MQYRQDFSINNFQFWDGATDAVDAVYKSGKLDELEALVEEHFEGMIPTKVEINDFVWHNSDEICKALGIPCL